MTTKMLKIAIFLLGFSLAVLCDDSRFAFHAHLTKGNEDFQYPPLIKIAWFNFLELDDSDRPWTWCGGESFWINDEFDYTMVMTQETFDKNITTDPAVLGWWAETFSVPEEEIAKIKYAMGYVMGHYDNDYPCGFGNDQSFDPPPGPNGEVAVAERYAVFYRNGVWPGTGPDEECSFVDWTSKFPQGFSCGLAVTQPNGCYFDQFVPIDCSEVILKVASPRRCNDDEDFEDDCFDFPNWT